MAIQFGIGLGFIILTVIIHAITIDRTMHALDNVGPFIFKHFNKFWKLSIITFTVLMIFGAHIIEIWIWAGLYILIDALPDLEAALYFSTTTFTTVGYGDIFLEENWRLLSSIQSANGFLLFGWSTAFIFEIMNKIYKEDTIRKIKK